MGPREPFSSRQRDSQADSARSPARAPGREVGAASHARLAAGRHIPHHTTQNRRHSYLQPWDSVRILEEYEEQRRVGTAKALEETEETLFGEDEEEDEGNVRKLRSNPVRKDVWAPPRWLTAGAPRKESSLSRRVPSVS